MLPKTSGIYRIVYLGDGREYIGSAVNFRQRWYLHLSQLRNGKHHSKHLQRVFDKYGEESLVCEVIEDIFIPPGLDKMQMRDRILPIEQEWLDERQPAMNGSKTAGSMLGFKQSEETKQKISESNKGRTNSPETRAKISAANKGKKKPPGRKLDEAHIAAISESNRTRVLSDEARANMGAGQKRRYEDPEERRKQSERKKGIKPTDEHRRKLSESSALRGKPRTDEAKAKISAALTGHSVSQETRDKIGAANKAVQARKKLEAEQRSQEGLDGNPDSECA